MGSRMKSRSPAAVRLSLVVRLWTWVTAFVDPRPVLAQLASSPNQTMPAKELRFLVACLHGGSWCHGFLYSSDDKVRFEVVQPESAKGFSFEAPRAQVMIHSLPPRCRKAPQNLTGYRWGGRCFSKKTMKCEMARDAN
jgi:hypothetical protein